MLLYNQKYYTNNFSKWHPLLLRHTTARLCYSRNLEKSKLCRISTATLFIFSVKCLTVITNVRHGSRKKIRACQAFSPAFYKFLVEILINL